MAGGFPLQKWSSNHPELLTNLPITHNDTTSSVGLETFMIKILGLCWQPSTNTYQFTSWPTTDRKITKKDYLIRDCSTFWSFRFYFFSCDPSKNVYTRTLDIQIWMGWFFISWFTGSLELLPPTATWAQQIKHTSAATYLTQTIELHGFSDASHLAMAAVIYIRIVDNSGKVTVNLVCSKTRIASLKRLTIPRLELTAALLLARLISNVQKALEMFEISVFLWMDSAVILTWIYTHSSRWKDFVWNWVTSIQDLTPSASWRFVPRKQNPTDCASRGINVKQLKNHSLWWTSPPWFIQSSST